MQNLNSKCIVVLAGVCDVDIAKYINHGDIVIAIDGGYDTLALANINVDVLIGDCDSISASNFLGQTIKFDSQKDDTDFKCGLNYIEENYPNYPIYVFAFASINRIDHVLVNLCNITSCVKFISNNQHIELLNADTIVKADQFTYYSFFAIEPIAKFSLQGFKYELLNYELMPFDPLCISNELSAPSGLITIDSGRVIMIKSKEN